METFLLFFIPLFVPIVILFGVFLYVLFTVKMYTEIVSNHELALWEKVLWGVFMIPLLPIVAPAYQFIVYGHHHVPHPSFHQKHTA